MMKKIISFTTISTRINSILPVLESLLSQEEEIDKIICYISKKPFLGGIDKGITTLPDSLIKLSNSTILEFCYTDNIGPLRKIFPALQAFPNDLILACDDDVIYPKDWAKTLILAHKKNPNCSIGVQTRILQTNQDGIFLPYIKSRLYSYSKKGVCPFNEKKVTNTNYVIIGKYGALYQKKIFDDHFFDTKKYLSLCPFADDLWIAAHLSKNNIPLALAKLSEDHFGDIDTPFQKTLFGAFNFNKGNDRALSNLQHLFNTSKGVI